MIGKLSGKVDSLASDHLIIDVGGVGYLVFCSSRLLGSVNSGDAISLAIETHVREDHIHLFGFANAEEKKAFSVLQSVKGVGSRMALAILSALSVAEIQTALAQRDKGAFERVSGVGKKLAERIVIELKDKIITDVGSIEISQSYGAGNNSAASDAISALVSLGVSRSDAQNRVNQILASNPDANLNELIRLALKQGATK